MSDWSSIDVTVVCGGSIERCCKKVWSMSFSNQHCGRNSYTKPDGLRRDAILDDASLFWMMVIGE